MNFALAGDGAAFGCCVLFRPGRFDEAAQHFGDAPGLSDAAARREGRLGVENLADRADSSLPDVRLEAVEKMARRRYVIRMDPQPGIDERTDQPSPDRPLMIGSIAGPQIAEVARLEIG